MGGLRRHTAIPAQASHDPLVTPVTGTPENRNLPSPWCVIQRQTRSLRTMTELAPGEFTP